MKRLVTKRGLTIVAIVGAAGLVVACSGAQVEEKTSNDKAGWTVDLDWHPHDDDAPPPGDSYSGGGAQTNCWPIAAHAYNMTKSQASSALDMMLSKDVWGAMDKTSVLGEIGLQFNRINSHRVNNAAGSIATCTLGGTCPTVDPQEVQLPGYERVDAHLIGGIEHRRSRSTEGNGSGPCGEVRSPPFSGGDGSRADCRTFVRNSVACRRFLQRPKVGQACVPKEAVATRSRSGARAVPRDATSKVGT